MKRLKDISSSLLLLGCMAAVLAFPESAAKGTERGLELCLGSIIPSLFPMMLLSILVVECGGARKLGRLCAPLSRRLFGLPGEAATAALLAMLGGYPAGARAVVGLYDQGAVTKEQAQRMALFCFCAGPAFLIGMVGGLTGSPAMGWLLMGVQLIAVTATGVVVSRLKQLPEQRGMAAEKTAAGGSFAGAIVSSVSKASEAMLQVCLYVIIFSAANELLEAVGVTRAVVSALTAAGIGDRLADAALPVLLEVTGGCVSAVGVGLPVIAFAVGFGGLSVQMQVLALTERLEVNKAAFFLARIFQGALSTALTVAAIELLPDGAAVQAAADISGAKLSGSPQGAVMLLVMCAMCVLCMPGNNGSERQINRKSPAHNAVKALRG